MREPVSSRHQEECTLTQAVGEWLVTWETILMRLGQCSLMLNRTVTQWCHHHQQSLFCLYRATPFVRMKLIQFYLCDSSCAYSWFLSFYHHTQFGRNGKITMLADRTRKQLNTEGMLLPLEGSQQLQKLKKTAKQIFIIFACCPGGSLYKPLWSSSILEIYSCVLGKQTLLCIRKGIFHIKNKDLCSIEMGRKCFLREFLLWLVECMVHI